MGALKILELTEEVKGKLGIWELNDSCADLKEQYSFTDEEKALFLKITNEQRQCEFLSVRLLLKKMLNDKAEIAYDDRGKPVLNNNLNISISHSSRLAVVLLSDQLAGIDVESLNRSTEKIARRFLSDQEMEHIQNTSTPSFTRILYWCAKEALFKCTPSSEIDFKNHIVIHPFLPSMGSGKFYGRLLKDKQDITFAFSYFIFKNNAVVYCTETVKQDNIVIENKQEK